MTHKLHKISAEICIIGGGASGLVAAIKAKDEAPDASIIVLEKLGEPGKKVAAAGNGRCNLSNINCSGWNRTSDFFSSIGVITRVESEGRIYPYSEDGRDVVRALVRACEKRGVRILTRRQVTAISREIMTSAGLEKDAGAKSVFCIKAEFNKPKAYRPGPEDGPIIVKAEKVLIASGGKSKPKLGTSGDGYGFAKALGHSISPLIPVLTGVETVEDIKDMGLSGVRQKVRLSLLNSEGAEIFQEDGEIQFTDYGISGICVFDMSRFLTEKDLSGYRINVDFAPDFSEEYLSTLEKESLSSMVKAPLAKVISECKDLKTFPLIPKKLMGWDMAQVTRGGVPLSEVNEETGESILVTGLYFSGEMLDRDFRCGGYNLEHAWETGIRAGIAMGKSL